MRTLAEVKQRFSISPETGLTAEQVEASRREFGANRLTPLPREPIWKKFIEKFEDPIIKILLAAALLAMVVDLFKHDLSGTLGGIGLGLIVVLIGGAFALRQGYWVPTISFVLAIVLFVLGLSSGHFLVEGMAVMVAVMLATGVAFASEYQSDREFELLNARKDDIKVKVIRGGEPRTVAMEDVVVGDVISLEMGDEIPADGRVVKANELYVDQSLMTGESEPVRKQHVPDAEAAAGPDQPGCLYRGTQVVDGTALMCVAAVGDATYLGEIARKLSAEAEDDEEAEGAETQERRVKRKLTISKEMTPLQVKLTQLAELISNVGYAAAVLIFAAQFLYGLAVGKVYWPGSWEQFLNVFGVLLGYFVNMVIIIVVAVPEGLPMSVTISLALAMRKMTRANSLVRQLVACETIGSATVICSDKTGTLTQNKMRVDRVEVGGKNHDRDRPDWVKPDAAAGWPRDGRPADWIALNAAVNSTAYLEEKDGQVLTAGNITEGALLQYLREAGVKYGPLRQQFPALYQLHFSSERKRMTTVIRYGGRLVALVKGAPEWVLEHSTSYQTPGGEARPWDDAARSAVEDALQDSSVHAMRTLAFAYHVLPEGTPEDEDALHERREEMERDLVYVGSVAIRDPLRDDVKAAVEECRRAGIEVKMITGDNVETARAIGYSIGLLADPQAPIDTDDAVVMTHGRFDELYHNDPEALRRRLPRLRVLARALPIDKYRMVTMLQDLGEVVAVTGDGTNDAPALKKADVGLAMGIAGTEVSKEASKIVLLDDSFSTIVSAVHWGRSLYENIQRFLQFQLTINVSALTIFFLGVLIGVEAPFTVLQLLWINVIMDTFAAIALCSEPPRPGVMKAPPKRRDENILTPAMVRTILITASFFVVMMLGLLVAMKGDPARPGLFAEGAHQKKDANLLWSVEVAGSRVSVPAKYLHEKDVRDHGFTRTWMISVPEGDESAPAELRGLDGRECEAHFTVLQVSIFFSVYVFFQVWNQINCRSLTPRESGFHKIRKNPTFLAIASTIAVGQVLIVTFGSEVFKVTPLEPVTWLWIILSTASVLVFAEVVRVIRRLTEGGPGTPAEPGHPAGQPHREHQPAMSGHAG